MPTQLDFVTIGDLVDMYVYHGTITVIDGDKKEAIVSATTTATNERSV